MGLAGWAKGGALRDPAPQACQKPQAAVRDAQASFLGEFLRDRRLRAFVRAGQLELVLWDHLGECVGPPHMRCWQPIVYSHAILEAWGSGLHLLISDIDEYFVLPKANTTFAGVLEGNCTNGRAMVRPRSPPSHPLARSPIHWWSWRPSPAREHPWRHMLPASLLAAGPPCLSTLTACQHCVEQAGSLVSGRGVELCWLPVKGLVCASAHWKP